MTTRVLIVEDEPEFLRRFANAVLMDPELALAGSAGSGRAAIAMLDAAAPDVVLLDLGLPDMNGVEVIRHAMRRPHPCDVLVVSMFDDDQNVLDSIEAGAAGYLLKDVSSETLVAAVTAAARGEAFLQSTVTGRVVAAFARLMESGGPRAEALVMPLSPREREILALLGTGASNKEIADRLCLAEGTVKNHVTNVLTKLDVRDRTQAALRARQLGLA